MACSAADVVLVGLCDGHLDTKRHQSTFMTNKMGGQPDVPPPLSRLCPGCARCGTALVLVVQVYCPLEGSPYHRTLHVLACPAEECSGRSECWSVLRSQCLEADARGRPTPPPEQPRSATDWCDSADDWGMEGDQEDWGGPGMKTSEETAQNGNKGEDPSPVAMEMSCKLEELQLEPSEDRAPSFRPYFVSVVEESDLCGEDRDLAHAQELLRDYEKREGVAVEDLDRCEDAAVGEEKYEKTKVKHGDAVFARFMKRISVCPEQILRYCRGAEPLFISEPPVNMPQVVSACTSCGGPRTFELQLMPALVSLLRAERSEMQLEFGTVLVYTCLSSCWTSGTNRAVEEFCFVQSDPDQQLFR